MNFQERYQYNPQTDLLGKGGFARVYKAKDTLLDRDVAIKIFNVTDQSQYTVVEEIKKVIRFRHPNLLAYYDVAILEHNNALGEKEAMQIGVMELANAGDLKQFAKNNPGSPLLYSLLQQVLSGLEYLHSKGIIHRDLKPQNILLVQEDGVLTAKISDFGISKNMDAGTSNSSMAIGTIEYMAPEQFNPAKYGINGKIGTNVDLWSFGVMVHELLTQGSLFGQRDGNTTAEQIMSAILSTEIPAGIESLPEPYRTTVKKCLVKDAKERVQRAKDLIALLEGDIDTNHDKPLYNETAFLPKLPSSSNETKVYNKQNFDWQTSENNIATIAIQPKSGKTKWLPVPVIFILLAGIGILWTIVGRKTKTTIVLTEKQLQEENSARLFYKEKIKQNWDSLSEKHPASLIAVLKEIDSNLVFTAGGTFNMGSDVYQSFDYEKPVHTVTVGSFYISKYEVTQAQWQALMGNNPSANKCDNCPVENISWEDANAYCQKLTKLTGKPCRLPTEAEWEYAALGGSRSSGYMYSGGDNIDDVGWYESNSGITTHPVGQKQPNELGLYDMTGNVDEFCGDWYDPYYYHSSPAQNPQGPVAAGYGYARAYRGGSWRTNAQFSRAACRGGQLESGAYDNTTGFRIVVSF